MNSLAPRYGYFMAFDTKHFRNLVQCTSPSPAYQSAHFTVSSSSLDPVILKTAFPLEIWKMIYTVLMYIFWVLVKFGIFPYAYWPSPFFFGGLVIHVLCPFYYCAFIFFLLNCKKSYIGNIEDNVNIPSHCFLALRWQFWRLSL